MKVLAIASAVLSAFASFVSAQQDWTEPVGDPSGNPIFTPSLHEQVPVGKPYAVTWKPTTPGTITIVLYKGPGNNIIPQYAIAKKIENSGTFMWTPDTSFPDTKEGYGLRIIVDATGQNQWSTQFGFSNPDFKSDTLTTTVTASGSATATGSLSTTVTVTASTNSTRTGTTKTVTSTFTRNGTTTTKPATNTITSPTTLVTTTATSNETSATTTGPPASSSSGAAANMAVSYGIGAIAIAVAGLGIF